ncbi:MAG TPA: hypothetical protein PK020_15610 [Ilumatobacteraceae bacterium]|nr:hypothetical protein [Ilumatobacteraceae bacterium]HRB05202.1 hypothetical protein [Ilumatobacteraceae bacterium]
MNRRSFLATLIGTPALIALVAACGDDSVQGNNSVQGNDSQDGGGYAVSTDANSVVFRIGQEGGFTTRGSEFIHMPSLLIAGDGAMYTPGATTLQYPGALVPALVQGTITGAGIQKVIKLADLAGLLGAIPDYSLADGFVIADAPDTVVTLTVNGVTYEHRANALGIDSPTGDSSPARNNLSKFVELLSDLPTAVGVDNVGPGAPMVAESYRFQSVVVNPADWTQPSPTIVTWPGDSGVLLADAAECASVSAAKVGDLFEQANQLTFFQENDVVYQLSVIATLPGEPSC